MAKFHINGKGEAGKCTATQGGCPFGGDEKHYPTPEAAREAYEKSATTKKGLFSRFTSKKEPNPVAQKDRRSTDGALDVRRFEGLLAIAKKEKWDTAPNGQVIRVTGSKQNTFEALSELQRNDREGGTAFEQADRLKEAYTRLREAGEVETPSYGPEVLSRDTFLRMVAPATHDAVSTVEESLTQSGWLVRVNADQTDETRGYSASF
jgi:hypothetical protein